MRKIITLAYNKLKALYYHLIRGSKSTKVLNACLAVVLLVMLYFAVYKPITADQYVTASDEESGYVDVAITASSYDYASDMSYVSPEIYKTIEQQSNVSEEQATSSTINNLFPFADQLPEYGENYYIDYPTDDGTLLIIANGSTGKTDATKWLADNGADVNSLDISWTIK